MLYSKTNKIERFFSGAWADKIASMAGGLSIPLVPMKHAYVVSEQIEGAANLPNIRDHDYSIYFRVQNSSLCLGGYEPNPAILDKVSPIIEGKMKL